MNIYRVVLSIQDYDTMENINKITGSCEFNDENWVNLEVIQEYPNLLEYITDEELNALKNKEIDTVVFTALSSV